MPTISPPKNIYRELRKLNFQEHSRRLNSAGDPWEGKAERQERVSENELRELLNNTRNKLSALKVVINHNQRKLKNLSGGLPEALELMNKLDELYKQREELQKGRHLIASHLGVSQQKRNISQENI